ncbi:MAG: Trk system potassium transporter TrkA [Eubacterium sp.]|nr:Trk system potassium transporter TrkA [Eubacterium sp.]
MNIMIAGCGKVGKSIAMRLCEEGHQVTVIDSNEAALQSVKSSLDVMGYHGDCTSINVLEEAGIRHTDLLITVTSDDEKNMLTCLVARKVGGCQTIARVRSPQYAEDIKYIKEDLGLSMSINPEKVAADEMIRLIQVPSALEVESFAKGRVNLISFAVLENSVLDGIKLKQLHSKIGMNALICVAAKGDKVVIPDGEYEIEVGDRLWVTLSYADINTFFNKVGIKTKTIKNVLIAGGGTMTYYLAQKLINLKMDVKIIEMNPERADKLAESLPKAMIICGDATDKSLLTEEAIDEMDAICALMNEDEENILLSLYAHKYSPAKIMTRIHRDSYEELVSELPVGQTISTKRITADYILRYIRAMQNSLGSEVETLYRLVDGRVEALEFNIGAGFIGSGKSLKDLSLISGTLICSIYRGGKIIRPGGNDTLEAGDSVVIVTTHKGINSLDEIIRR